MTKNVLLIVALIFTGLSFGQPPGDGPGPKDKRQEKEEFIKAQKVAFISTELALTPKEAEVFWPVYNEYEAEIEAIRKERRGYLKELEDIDNITEDRAYELTKLLFETEQAENGIRLKYLDKFAEVLGKKKAAKVFMAEEKFKRHLLKILKNDGPPGGHKGPHGPGGPKGGPHGPVPDDF